MNTEYDVIVLGTGLKECMLAGLLAKFPKKTEGEAPKEGAKILQLDRNGYYGSDSASLNLTNLWKHFRPGQEPKKEYGENRDWNVDLIPKYIMANGSLVKLLLKTNVSQYLEWKAVDGTFVYQFDKGGFFKGAKGVIHKVPATASEALKSDLMGMFEKNRCKNFFQYIQDYEKDKPQTQKGFGPDVPFKDIIKKFNLEPNTVDFVGHAVALYTNDDFLEQKALPTIDKMQLYFNSFGRYGNSPFIYPVWGLSGLAEGFSRLCALYGGTYMLNRDVEEILYDENGNFRGIKSQGEEAYGKILITEPSYVQKFNKVKSVGKVIRRICILDHSIPKTKDVASCQIILPQKQVNRKNDIFIAVLNSTHCVCKKGYYLAIISTMVETDNPKEEIQPAMDIIGTPLETFDKISDIYKPIDTEFKGNVYITSSFDPQSHFENDTDNVIEIYEKITGAKLDLNIEEEGENKETAQ
jgi:Rab GDP dissociation inhibitor